MALGFRPVTHAHRNPRHPSARSNLLKAHGSETGPDKYRALAAADVFASTTQHKGFGLVFLEAMAFGLPIICYGQSADRRRGIGESNARPVEEYFIDRCAWRYETDLDRAIAARHN